MPVRIFQPQCYVAVTVLRVGYAEVIFIQPGGKLDTMWRDAWQRLASSYPTSRWDVAVNLRRDFDWLTAFAVSNRSDFDCTG